MAYYGSSAERALLAVTTSSADQKARILSWPEQRGVRCRMVEQVVEELGTLDIAVNNAGLNRNGAAEDCSEGDWDDTFNLNTRATFLCCQAEGRHMLAQGVFPNLYLASAESFRVY